MNINTASILTHDTIDNIQQLSHDIIDTTFNSAIPIINNLANTNFNVTNIKSNLLQYKMKDYNDSIYILVEVPGISKDNCNVNYINNILSITGKTSYNCDNDNDNDNDNDSRWGFIKDKNDEKNINLNCNINKKDINIKYEYGVLKIIINKYNTSDSSINIG